MRKKRLLALALLGCSISFGQTPAADSLKNLLQIHTQQDTARVDLLNSYAREFARANQKKADSLIILSISLSERIKYPRGKGMALAIRGGAYHTASMDSLAYQSFDQSKQILEKLNDKKALAYMYRVKANVLMDDGRHAECLDNFLKGLKLAQEAGDIKEVIDIERTIGYFYNTVGEPEKAIPYQTDALKQAQSIGYIGGITGAYNAIGKTYKTTGKYPASLDAYTKGLVIDEQIKDSPNIYIDHSNLADVYERMRNYQMAFFHVRQAYNYWKQFPKSTLIPWDEWVLAKIHTHSGNFDSGMYYARNSLEHSYQLGYRLYLREITQVLSEAAAGLNQWDTAYKYQVMSSHYKDSLIGAETARRTAMLQASFDLDKKQTEIALLKKDKDLQQAETRKERAFLVMVLGGLISLIVLAIILMRNNRQKQKANVLLQSQKQEIDEKAKELSIQKDNLEQSYRNVELLGEIGRKITSSLSVEKIISTVYDNVNSLMDASVFGIGIYNDPLKRIEFPATYENGEPLPFYSNSIYDENRFDATCFRSGNEIVMGDMGEEYKNYIQDIQKPKAGDQTVSLIYLPLRVKEKKLGVITVQSFQKNAYSDYELFMLRNIAVYTAIALENADAFNTLNQTLTSLKKTQTQLIQSEKMASLGELTAGIAHEIQNPLNFVNNFSEVSSEITDEIIDAIAQNNSEEAKSLSGLLKENLQKISYHGKRADSIVKNMLQHSRKSTGRKEPTDINSLVDEYLRLSYHGLRAKDKSFNAILETHFDKAVNQVELVPEDIGRVLLNLFNNAFYSVAKKMSQNESGYEPTVIVRTERKNEHVTVYVKDNGVGMSEKTLEKIYQPFFTTKPAGEGTGLGLSLSYDIITKAHNGQLKVETKEGEGAEFIIELPINQ
ncbi:MAG: ATP-binding protein [Flavisolibacter sp.]